MNITFIDHSSFWVELEHAILLFDYIGGEIPAADTDKQLYVFSSHCHHDHYSEGIFKSEITRFQPIYILSDDIEPQTVPSDFGKQVRFIGPNVTEIINEELKIHTFMSTDEGVAFIIEIEGQTIYHAGDLNNWYWEEEPDVWNITVNEEYLAELEKMQRFTIDVAFVPVDPRQGELRYLGIDQFVEIVGAEALVPMHFWGDFTVVTKLVEREQSKAYRDKIIQITEKEQLISK